MRKRLRRVTERSISAVIFRAKKRLARELVLRKPVFDKWLSWATDVQERLETGSSVRASIVEEAVLAEGTGPNIVVPADANEVRRLRGQQEDDFAVIVRHGAAVSLHLQRFGRTQTKQMDYPSASAASYAYAQTCSELKSQGWNDSY